MRFLTKDTNAAAADASSSILPKLIYYFATSQIYLLPVVPVNFFIFSAKCALKYSFRNKNYRCHIQNELYLSIKLWEIIFQSLVGTFKRNGRLVELAKTFCNLFKYL